MDTNNSNNSTTIESTSSPDPDGEREDLQGDGDKDLDSLKMPRRNIMQPNYNWVDITKSFEEDCKLLSLGELVHDDMFGLLEGMSAVEMMDPKMDAGMTCNQTQRKVRNLQESLDAGTLKVEDLTNAELIGIFDDTLACFVTWMEGHSLAQTVFINLYLHNPLGVIVDPTLKAFSVGMLRLVDVVMERINWASVFEEEDFQPMSYSMKMADHLSDSQTMSMLRDADESLNKLVRAARPRADSVSEDMPTQELKHAMAEGVHARVKFLRTFFQVVTELVRERSANSTNTAPLVAEARKHLAQMEDLLAVMRKTGVHGIERTARDGDESCIFVMGFEPLVNQRLLPPTFPRYTQITSRLKTYDWLERMIEQLVQACSVVDITNIHELIEFCCEYSSKSPCLLARSLLQLMILPQSKRLYGSVLLQDCLRDTVRWFSGPPALLPRCTTLHNNPRVKECMDAFLAQALRPLTYIIQVTGHNHARQRDKWTHLLEEWSVLQEESERLDAYLHTLLIRQASELPPQALPAASTYRACVGAWTLYHTLQIMLRYTVSGLELDLYAVHEFCYVYWYLAEGIFSWLISTLSRVDTFAVEHETFWGSSGAKTPSSGKKNRNKKAAAAGKIQRPHAREIIICQALQALCGGYYKALLAMEHEGRLMKRVGEFDSEHVRYTHRFSPFQTLVTPPHLSYPQFLEMTDVTRYNPPLQPSDLYSGAAKAFQQARQFLESLPAAVQQQQQQQRAERSCCGVTAADIETLLRIAKTNFVVIRLLSSGHGKGSNVTPEFDFSSHKHFPIIKLP